MWSYSELRCVKANELSCSSEDLAEKLNVRYHNGDDIRTASDVDKIKGTNTIFTRKREKRI